MKLNIVSQKKAEMDKTNNQQSSGSRGGHLSKILSQIKAEPRLQVTKFSGGKFLKFLIYCSAYFLIKDAPVNVQRLSDQRVTGTSCRGRQPSDREVVYVSLQSENVVPASPFTRKVIYRWDGIELWRRQCAARYI